MQNITNSSVTTVDQLGQPSITAGSYVFKHVVHKYVCSSLPTFENLAKQNKFQVKTMFGSGGIVGLAERIINDTRLVQCQCLAPRFAS